MNFSYSLCGAITLSSLLPVMPRPTILPNQVAPRQTATIRTKQLATSGLITVQLPLANGAVGSFVLDTGARGCFIDRGLCDKLALSVTPAISKGKREIIAFSLNDGRPAEIAEVPVNLGTINLEVEMYVVDKGRLASMFRNEVDGIVGMSVLEQLAVKIDIQKGEITCWYPGGLDPDKIREIIPPAASLVPIRIKELRPTLAIRIDDQLMTNVLLDTGSQHSWIKRDKVKGLALEFTRKNVRQQTLYGETSMDFARYKDVQIGAENMGPRELGLARPRLDFAEDGVLGMDILVGRTIWLDFAGGSMYWK